MKKALTLIMSVIMLSASFSGCSRQEPVTITVWHYYVGRLQNEFEQVAATFNNSAGKEKGIILDVVYMESIDTLTQKIVDASENRIGADHLPNLIFAYNSTTYDLDELGLIVDIKPYFTDQELERYIPAFLKEGISGEKNMLLNFPVAKSTELLYIENVAYQAFKEAVSASDQYDDIDDSMFCTFEGIMRMADIYYRWTDDQTPEIPYDGKSLFGMDATSNYISVCARQLSGQPPITVADGIPALTLDKETAKTLWTYYVNAIVTGRFAEIGWYRADDMKTGDLIAYLGSSGGASYFPTSLHIDGKEYDTELLCLKQPVFEGKTNVTLQQGAGMSVIKTDERRQRAAAAFLKWFTAPEQNVHYCVVSGYCPVMKREYIGDILEKALEKAMTGDIAQQNIAHVLTLASEQMNGYELTVDKEYPGSYDIRNMLGESLSDAAKGARSAFLEDIASGSAYQDAVDRQISDEAFESWYATIQSSFDSMTIR